MPLYLNKNRAISISKTNIPQNEKKRQILAVCVIDGLNGRNLNLDWVEFDTNNALVDYVDEMCHVSA